MLNLILGRDWTACRDEVLRRISRDVAAEKGNRILMVPELISHETERRLCRAAGDTASRYAEVLSFTRLSQRVSAEMEFAPEECLDNGGRVVAMASAARQMASKLKAYASVETRPEFLTGLIDEVDEFKRCCISSQDLMEASRQTEGGLAQKLEELSLLLESYDALCSRGKRDPRDQMTWLLEKMELGDFGENHVFYIDGFPDFTRQHLAILEHLIRVSPMVTVSMNCDSVTSHQLAFEKGAATAAELIRCAKNMGVEIKIEEIPERESPLTAVRHCLFQGIVKPGSCKDVLRVIQADTVAEECRCAAARVMELVQSGYRYRDIAVVCGDLPGYQSVLGMTFRRSGIPLYLAGKEDILNKSVISTVLSAMDAALGGFEQKEVLRYLRSVLSPVDADTCDLLENYAITWGLRGSKWLNSWENHPDGLSGVWDNSSTALLSRLNEARALAMTPLEHMFRDFRKAENLKGQILAVHGFLKELRLEERLEELADKMDEAGDDRSAQVLNQLWEILVGAMEQMYDVLGDTVWDGDTFIRLFRLLLSQYDVGTIPPVLDAVQAGSVSAMRCHQQKHLIVLGAREGNLPGYTGSTGVLTDQERVALRSMGLPLTGGAMEGIQAEFSEIYGVFCGAEETVWVTFSDGQPSFVCRRLGELAGGIATAAPSFVLSDPDEAGAYLARFHAADAARRLGVEDSYNSTLQKGAYGFGKVAREHIDVLYGKSLMLSASQIDRQAECRLSYFLKYGLRLKERKEATVDPAEFGTYVHWVLENTARRVKEMGGFPSVSIEKTLQIADAFSNEYTQEHFSQLDSQRLTYLFRRNVQELHMVVQELWEELQESKFQPQGFEVNFGGGEGLPAIDISGSRMQASLRGFVDRVDVWQQNGQSYYRVVDYKTGKKDFDYCDIFAGVGLQMLLYLFALEECGSSVVGDHPIAAGVQYFPARMPYISSAGALSGEELANQRSKLLKRKGLLLNDKEVLNAMEPLDHTKRLSCSVKKDGTVTGDLATREQLGQLKTYILKTLGKMVDEIASGTVDPNPYTRGSSHSACAFCPYGSVCHSQTVEGRRNFKAMTEQRFWQEIEKEVKSDG